MPSNRLDTIPDGLPMMSGEVSSEPDLSNLLSELQAAEEREVELASGTESEAAKAPEPRRLETNCWDFSDTDSEPEDFDGRQTSLWCPPPDVKAAAGRLFAGRELFPAAPIHEPPPVAKPARHAGDAIRSVAANRRRPPAPSEWLPPRAHVVPGLSVRAESAGSSDGDDQAASAAPQAIGLDARQALLRAPVVRLHRITASTVNSARCGSSRLIA